MNIPLNYPFKYRIGKGEWKMSKKKINMKIKIEFKRSKILTLWFFLKASFKVLICGFRQLWEGES